MAKSLKFIGKDDYNNTIKFNMTQNDSSKSVELYFNKDIRLQGGVLLYQDAPIGSYYDAELVEPVGNTVVATFVKHMPMLGTEKSEIDTEGASSFLNAGLKIRVTVYNGDTPSDFKCIGYMKLYY